ncbi:MAG TPA: hypothetical protein VED67_03440 [Thermodesulfovibrionales bacterium]|nr:hypothetical protein [Thermodesulfovibrionales bacterium]
MTSRADQNDERRGGEHGGETTPEEPKMNSQECRLDISLHAVPSSIGTSGGKEVSFKRGILSIKNTGQAVVSGLVPHATLGQEGGSVQDVSEAFSRSKTVESIQPGETVEWDLYEHLLPAHAGAASKVHMFGYRAVLNWWFELVVWAEYRCQDAATFLQTPITRWKLRWSLAKPPMDEVDLSIEVVKG